MITVTDTTVTDTTVTDTLITSIVTSAKRKASEEIKTVDHFRQLVSDNQSPNVYMPLLLARAFSVCDGDTLKTDCQLGKTWTYIVQAAKTAHSEAGLTMKPNGSTSLKNLVSKWTVSQAPTDEAKKESADAAKAKREKIVQDKVDEAVKEALSAVDFVESLTLAEMIAKLSKMDVSEFLGLSTKNLITLSNTLMQAATGTALIECEPVQPIDTQPTLNS